MPPQATAVSPQTLIDAAKAPILAYNDKNWEKAKTSITPNFVYDEVAIQRKVEGADQTLALWKGWAEAFPDSKATFNAAHVSGSTVVLEVTWRGTHQGPLQTPKGAIPPTGKRISGRDRPAAYVPAHRSGRGVVEMLAGPGRGDACHLGLGEVAPGPSQGLLRGVRVAAGVTRDRLHQGERRALPLGEDTAGLVLPHPSEQVCR